MSHQFRPALYFCAMKTLLQRLLEVPANRQAMVVVLLVTLPLWVLVAAWDTTIMTANAMGANSAYLAPASLRIVQHLLLLPPVLILYFLATERRLRLRTLAMEVTRQLLFAVFFSALVRPALILSSALLHAHEGPDLTVTDIIVRGLSPFPWFISSMVAYLLVYFFGLALIRLVTMALDLRRGKLAEEKLRSLWLDARLRTLRNQLDPHFFFNCLHTISALIRVDVEKADSMIADVSELLRYTLRETRSEFCTLEQELTYIRRYICIEQIRFEDRLDFALEVPTGFMTARLPSLILQPLVENAIKHGVAAHPRADTIGITVTARNSHLVIQIVNGCAPAGSDKTTNSTGIGLRHVRERLEALYGEEARLDAGTDKRGAWLSVLVLPLQLAETASPAEALPMVSA
ncbi:MAG TPA: histidine kinase [Gammaproteobacteria bacterium]|nr:histidine kinase [Gammaproteobacteria bacterium]